MMHGNINMKKNLLDDLKDRRGYTYLKKEALDRTMWRAGFGRGFGPVVNEMSKTGAFLVQSFESLS
jgi:hypothetical protein